MRRWRLGRRVCIRAPPMYAFPRELSEHWIQPIISPFFLLLHCYLCLALSTVMRMYCTALHWQSVRLWQVDARVCDVGITHHLRSASIYGSSYSKWWPTHKWPIASVRLMLAVVVVVVAFPPLSDEADVVIIGLTVVQNHRSAGKHFLLANCIDRTIRALVKAVKSFSGIHPTSWRIPWEPGAAKDGE